MSNFVCEKCGANILDSRRGYYTGCPHYEADLVRDEKTNEWIPNKKRKPVSIIDFLLKAF